MKHRIARWLAIVGMALNALWPLLASAGPQELTTIICSAHGMQQVSLSDSGPLPSAPERNLLPHCAFCSSVGTSAAVLPGTALAFAAPALSQVRPIAVGLLLASSSDYTFPVPRGPPSLL